LSSFGCLRSICIYCGPQIENPSNNGLSRISHFSLQFPAENAWKIFWCFHLNLHWKTW
jgi:hypothetical protein